MTSALLHNGPHFSAAFGYFEWWYFHLIADGGWYLNFILHTTDMFAMNRQPYMSMSVLRVSQKAMYFRRSFTECPVIFGATALLADGLGCTISESDAAVNFDLSFPGASIVGTMRRTSPGVVFGDGALHRDRPTGKANYWIVPVPSAPFNAVLDLGGTKQPLRGTAYHDHNWGTVPIQDAFSGWMWGHMTFDDGSLVFYVTEARNGPIGLRYIAEVDGVRQVGTELGVTTGTTRPLRIREFPSTFSVSADFAGTTLRVDAKEVQLVREREHDIRDSIKVRYRRIACDAAIVRTGVVSPARGLAEYLAVNRR